MTEKLHRIYKKHNIMLCSKPGRTIRQALVAPKDPVDMLDKCGVIYNIECGSCSENYIGETGRSLKVRLKEHQKSARDGDYKSALSQHQLETGHQIDFDSLSVVQLVANLKHRKVPESIQIRLK